MGLGAGLLYIPSLALVGIWFSRKRSLAMGCVTSGIAVGKSQSLLALSSCACLSFQAFADRFSAKVASST